jgi:hypothetical protein
MIGDMYPAGGGGWIEVVCGVMFSGKSEELIRRVRRALIAKKRVQVFKSHLDERYAGLYHVSSHDGRTVEAVPIDSPEQIARALQPDTQVVAIDEAQFLPAGIVHLSTALAASAVESSTMPMGRNCASSIATTCGSGSSARAICSGESTGTASTVRPSWLDTW